MAVLAEDLGSASNTNTKQLTINRNFSSRGSGPRAQHRGAEVLCTDCVFHIRDSRCGVSVEKGIEDSRKYLIVHFLSTNS